VAIYWPNLQRPIATIVWGEGIIVHDYAKRLSNTTKLDDDCKMPFGKHEGKRLGDVPDYWFRWFLKQHWCDQFPDLVQYANHVGNE
jgi:hypothetical protein